MITFDPKQMPAKSGGKVYHFPEGEYDVEVVAATMRKKNGTDIDQLHLKLRAYSGEQTVLLDDYLTIEPARLRRMRNLCAAAGRLQDFEAGQVDESVFVGQFIRAKLKVESEKKADGKVFTRNRVAFYCEGKPTSGGTSLEIDENSIPEEPANCPF